MSNNMWWIIYTNAETGQRQTISISSPDLSDPQKAHEAARAIAKERLAKLGIKATDIQSKCVG